MSGGGGGGGGGGGLSNTTDLSDDILDADLILRRSVRRTWYRADSIRQYEVLVRVPTFLDRYRYSAGTFIFKSDRGVPVPVAIFYLC